MPVDITRSTKSYKAFLGLVHELFHAETAAFGARDDEGQKEIEDEVDPDYEYYLTKDPKVLINPKNGNDFMGKLTLEEENTRKKENDIRREQRITERALPYINKSRAKNFYKYIRFQHSEPYYGPHPIYGF
jgi:hypothetical protein